MRKLIVAAAALIACTGTAQAASFIYTPRSATAFAAPAGTGMMIDFNRPATWALLLVGFSMVGSALRRRNPNIVNA